MPTTNFPITISDSYVSALQVRTDEAGVDLVDLSGADLRAVNRLFTPGTAEQDYAPSKLDMDMYLGEPTNPLNVAVVPGTAQGQGSYVVGVPGRLTVPLPPSEPAGTRVDEVYLVVFDDAYDSSGLVTARVALRVGDVNAGRPGPDVAWMAHLLVASASTAAGASTYTLTDERTPAEMRGPTRHTWGFLAGRV